MKREKERIIDYLLKTLKVGRQWTASTTGSKGEIEVYCGKILTIYRKWYNII